MKLYCFHEILLLICSCTDSMHKAYFYTLLHLNSSCLDVHCPLWSPWFLSMSSSLQSWQERSNSQAWLSARKKKIPRSLLDPSCGALSHHHKWLLYNFCTPPLSLDTTLKKKKRCFLSVESELSYINFQGCKPGFCCPKAD